MPTPCLRRLRSFFHYISPKSGIQGHVKGLIAGAVNAIINKNKSVSDLVNGEKTGRRQDMYSVVIADDEKIIRSGLSKAIDWEGIGFCVRGVFSDGSEILDFLKQEVPDAILTDIKMSRVSGIDVARYVFENQLPCKVVFLSGYKEFELAVQGMQYGVEDYLLKPTNVKKLQETFEKLKAGLDRVRNQQKQDSEEHERLDEMLPYLQEQFFSDLVFGCMDQDREQIQNRMRLLFPEFPAETTACVLADLVIEDYKQYIREIWTDGFDPFRLELEKFLRQNGGDVSFYLIYKSNEKIRLFGFWPDADMHKQKEAACRALDKLVEALETRFGFHARYELLEVMQNVFQMESYREQLAFSDSDQENEFLSEQLRLIITNVCLGNFTAAEKILDDVLRELQDTYEGYRNHVMIDLFSGMAAALRDDQPRLYEYLHSHCSYRVIQGTAHVDNLRAYCRKLLEGMQTQAGKQKSNEDTDCLISRVQAYIQQHITEEISLETAAGQLYLSSSYLSRLFKKQTGESFVQYVTRKKIEKAIELLHDSQYKTYQVGEYLGYKTPRYFARLFRQQTGMNPSEYRSRVLHIGGSFDQE